MYNAVKVAFTPTLQALWRAPALILSPSAISRVFMAHVWAAWSNAIDERSRLVKEKLITAGAHGIVLDLGAG